MSSVKPSVLFVCRNFHQMAGGVERMSILIMNQMVKRGFRVGLITWDPDHAEPYYPLDDNVVWMKLNLGSPYEAATWKQRLARQFKIRKFARTFKPDVAIGFQVGSFVTAKTAMLGLGIPMIAAERNSPDLFDYVNSGAKMRKRAEFALGLANCITIQLESYRQKYAPFLRDKIVTIPNPVGQPALPDFPNEIISTPKRLLNVGRLSYQKNQHFLIKAFAKIAAQNPSWILTIVGEGEKRAELEALISNLGIDSQVELIGAVNDVELWYGNSTCLVFPSLWEGFPNALVEAMSFGLPAIGLNSTSGVNELIKHGYNGLLSANDEQLFAGAMQSMINDIDLRKDMGRKAYQSILEYQPEAIFDQWAGLFIDLASRK